MRHAIAAGLLLLGLAMPALAVLDDAYNKDAEYASAARAVLTAKDDLAKAQADPEPAALTMTRAQEALGQADAALRLSKIGAQVKVFTAVSDLLSARRQVQAAAAKQTLAQLQLQAAQVRFQAGATSAQELARVKDSASQADAAVADAQRTLAGAEGRVKIYGEVPADQVLPEPAAIDPATFTVNGHSLVIAAQNKVNEAERALQLAQGPDTSALERAALARSLASAQDTLRDTIRTQQDALDTAARRYAAARLHLGLSRDSLAIADTALASARKRHAAGAISKQALSEAEVAQLDAQAAYEAAISELWGATLAVEQAAGGGQ